MSIIKQIHVIVMYWVFWYYYIDYQQKRRKLFTWAVYVQFLCVTMYKYRYSNVMIKETHY